jgi:hypothetical protein
MARTGGGSRGTGPERVIVGGFGWPEKPGRIETCPQDGCVGGQILPTDLYCSNHDRFLPFVRNWTNATRMTAVVAVAALIYGCFALAAELNSWLPVFVVYAMIGLGAATFPLRLFPLTVRATILIWFVACAATLSYHLTGSHFRAIMVTTLLIAAACALGLHSGILSVQATLDDETVTNGDHRPRAVLAFVTGALIVSAAAGLAALSLLLFPEPYCLANPGLCLPP